MLAQGIEHWLGNGQRLAQQMARGVSAAKGDAFQNFRLRLFAKALQLRHFAGIAGGFEVADGFDAQFIVERLDFFGADPGNLQQLQQAGRSRGFEIIVVSQLAGGGQFGDFFLERFADALDFAEAVFGDDFVE
jgi:hypothetical protein